MKSLILLACCFAVLPSCNSGQPDARNPWQGDSTSIAVSSEELERDSLRSNGMYECCTKPECLECAGKTAGCECYNNIRRKDPICGDCLKGYKRGEGRLKLVSIPELEEIRKKETR